MAAECRLNKKQQRFQARESSQLMPITTLHIDIEGGYGGSSVSLFELLRRVDRGRLTPIVVHRQAGPVTEWYSKIGIRTYHVPEICSFVPRNTKALKNFIATLPRMRHVDRAARRIAEIAHAHDAKLVHLNYEGLFLLADRLRPILNLPMVAHSRAHLPNSRWGRWLARRLARNVSHIFFISPQEESRWAEICKDTPLSGEVMWNIARDPLPRRSFLDPPEVIYLGNIAWSKGTDRIVDIALAYKRRVVRPLTFAIYGDSRRGDQFVTKIEQRIKREGVADIIQLRGRVLDPSPILAQAFALLRPSREGDPWGRDVIEATTAGVPVIATGVFEGVVQNAVNGFLIEPFDADYFADRLSQLRADASLWESMSRAGQLRFEKFSGKPQVARFTAVVEKLVRLGSESAAA